MKKLTRPEKAQSSYDALVRDGYLIKGSLAEDDRSEVSWNGVKSI